jgi:arylsulfatase A-like enzyme
LRLKRQAPFCLFLWFYAPHAPFDRPLRMVNDFNGVAIPKPQSFDEYLSGYGGKPQGVVDAINKIGAQFLQRDAPRSLEELVKDHYCGIEANDENVGQVLSALEEQGTLDDTALVWSSDHGSSLANIASTTNASLHPHPADDPLPAAGQAGTTSDRMALNLDLAPTVLLKEQTPSSECADLPRHGAKSQ